MSNSHVQSHVERRLVKIGQLKKGECGWNAVGIEDLVECRRLEIRYLMFVFFFNHVKTWNVEHFSK